MGSGFDLTVLLKNAATGNFSSSQLTHETPSFGTTEIQVITGDFTGDGFADAFVFYSSTVTDSNNPSHVTIKFGARVGTAVDVNTVDSGLRFGDE